MDTHHLLSGNGGVLFDNHCLRPEFNSMQCDVRLCTDDSPLLPETKCLLVLGEFAMWKMFPETCKSTLGAMRGGLFHYKGIPAICSFLPQDAADNFKNYEKENNPLANDYSPDDIVSADGEEDEGDVKAFGKTKRANYAFWLRADVRKVKSILLGECEKLGSVSRQPSYKVYPPAPEIIHILKSTKGQHLFFDIETDYEQQNLQCFAFTFDGQTIYSVPILDYSYKPAYSNCHLILQALAIAIRDNTTVAHNGACFDFFVLANKYRIPIGKTYDTMIAHHRCFPDIEKSLGHCVSYWTWEKFHKDEDSHGYRTYEQMMDRMKYCGKDVYTMFLVKNTIDKYAHTIPGLASSIECAMNQIKPYLTMTLHGINVDERKVQGMVIENDKLMMQYNRMIELLIGPAGMAEIRGGRKVGMFAGSNPQCCRYFHDILGYKVMGYGKDKKDGSKSPSLGKKHLYKLALQYENPVITLICTYRGVKKETSRLQFVPWKLRFYDTLSQIPQISSNQQSEELGSVTSCAVSDSSPMDEEEADEVD
jgi:hypothetical protein